MRLAESGGVHGADSVYDGMHPWTDGEHTGRSSLVVVLAGGQRAARVGRRWSLDICGSIARRMGRHRGKIRRERRIRPEIIAGGCSRGQPRSFTGMQRPLHDVAGRARCTMYAASMCKSRRRRGHGEDVRRVGERCNDEVPLAVRCLLGEVLAIQSGPDTEAIRLSSRRTSPRVRIVAVRRTCRASGSSPLHSVSNRPRSSSTTSDVLAAFQRGFATLSFSPVQSGRRRGGLVPPDGWVTGVGLANRYAPCSGP